MTAPIQVDRYELFEPIAVGGMATVYFACQRGAANFSKVVAIKRMRPDLVHQKEFVDLFLDEARLASRVRHANVVSVIDVIASGEELLLVMEYFHGASVGRLLSAVRAANGTVPPEIAIAIISNVLHGLHAAHEAKGEKGEPLGIVHRDVSPQNILIGIDGVARVADFGIARASGQLHATEEGKTRGKAAYSAPEQLRGGPATRQLDLFAACAVLWELLVGRRLFEGETQAAVVTSVLTEPIEPPGLHVPTLPEELDDLVLRGLDRDPKKRPETALELATALEKVLPPAGPAAVARWMMELAGRELSEREEVVRRIESGAAAVPSSTPLVTTDAGTAGALSTSRSPSAAPPGLPPAKLRSRVIPFAIGTLAIASAALAAFFVGPSRSASPREARLPSTAVATAPSESAPVDVAPTPAASVSASGSASLPAKPPARPSAWQAHPKSKRCDPPYDLDSAGRKIFRVDCL